MIEARDVRSIRYLVSYFEFPEVNGAFDLRKKEAVVEGLIDKIDATYPEANVWVWADHPEFNSYPDFEVTVRSDLELALEENEKLRDVKWHVEEEIRFQIENHWLPAAIEEAGVFDEEEGDDDEDH